ncbi:hypothetical protein E2C01_089679 [Portunus trituberculatus]|uniref:Uncharacterized protein n=1 Tax=Portunus trituberculatus TaxID=210409 RepID=A0A5B7JN29_PORTR|nr:hypothetical protein [Portunus trituberculatus]
MATLLLHFTLDYSLSITAVINSSAFPSIWSEGGGGGGGGGGRDVM